MPTVILLDASLSMLRPVENGRGCNEGNNKRIKLPMDNPDGAGFDDNSSSQDKSSNENAMYGNNGIELMNLAKWGIDKLLTHFEQSYKLEQVAVLTYSSQCDLVVPFTRDIAEVRGKVIIVH